MQKKHARVMVLVHDTLSGCVLQMNEVSMKYFKGLSSYRADTNGIANDEKEITPKYPKQSYGSCA